MPRRPVPKRQNPKARRNGKRRSGSTYGVETIPKLAIGGAVAMTAMGIGNAMANSFRG